LGGGSEELMRKNYKLILSRKSMDSIDNAVNTLKKGDPIKIEYDPLFRTGKTRNFDGKYVEHDKERRLLTIERCAFSLFGVDFYSIKTLSYDRIQELDKIE
jgi:hypothetical protein